MEQKFIFENLNFKCFQKGKKFAQMFLFFRKKVFNLRLFLVWNLEIAGNALNNRNEKNDKIEGGDNENEETMGRMLQKCLSEEMGDRPDFQSLKLIIKKLNK